MHFPVFKYILHALLTLKFSVKIMKVYESSVLHSICNMFVKYETA